MATIPIQQAVELAIEHHKAGRLREAEQIYRQVLAQQPQHLIATHYLGIIASQMGNSEAAMDLIQRAIALRLDYVEAYCSLGDVLRSQNQIEQAIGIYRRAIALQPMYAEAHNNLGRALRDSGQLDEAIAEYRKAISFKPDYADAYYNLGNALHDKGQFDQAVTAYRHAIQFNPNWFQALINLGNTLENDGQIDEAAGAYRQAISIRPDDALGHINLGNILQAKGQLDQAAAIYRQAIALDPGFPEAHSNLSVALKEMGQLDESITEARRAIALRPTYVDAHSNLLYTICFHPDYDQKQILDEHRRWAKQHAEPLSHFIRRHDNDRNCDRRLKVGYVSPDFRNHVVGQNLLPLLSHHDHTQVEVFCYSNSFQSDALTQQFRSHADQWRSIAGMPDEAAAQLIRSDRIDLLVDLSLHSAGSRLPLFARKPAPVQLTYLGYCGTTGMDCMDYRLSDPYLDPPQSDLSLYSEKTLRLPRSYWCYRPQGAAPLPQAPPVGQNGYITFGCLNNFSKISAATLRLWAEVMRALPLSRLVLHAKAGVNRDQVLDRLGGAGLASERVEFVGCRPWPEYIQTYQRIDVSLDPFPFGGGITTCDSLWMGVPVVSLSGRTAVGRGGRSILSNVGLAELVALSPEEYLSIAARLAGDIPKLEELRDHLRQRMQSSPLMDADGFARDMEAIYRQAWKRWCGQAHLFEPSLLAAACGMAESSG